MNPIQHEAVIQFRCFRARGSGDELRGWHLYIWGQAWPLAMTKRVYICCRPFLADHASNCHFVLFIEAKLVYRFVSSPFSLQPLPHTTAPKLFVEVCLVEAEWKISVYFAILWRLAATEMRHVKKLPQKEISNLQVQTKVEETNLFCDVSFS